MNDHRVPYRVIASGRGHCPDCGRDGLGFAPIPGREPAGGCGPGDPPPKKRKDPNRVTCRYCGAAFIRLHGLALGADLELIRDPGEGLVKKEKKR